jgi:hypothetical protein
MRSTPWRTVALCATTAVLAGAGSAALADGGPPESATGAAPGKAADGRLTMRTCVIARNGEAPHEVTCPAGGLPPGKGKCVVARNGEAPHAVTCPAGGLPPGKPPIGGGCFATKLKTPDGKVHVFGGEAGTSTEAEDDDAQTAAAAKADAVKAEAAEAAGA